MGRYTNIPTFTRPLPLKTMQCCSCGKYTVSSLRLATLRHSAASCDGFDEDGEPPVSAFAVYCSCTTKQPRRPVTSTDASSFIPPATAADIMFARWRYWSLVFYQQFFQDLQNSAWMNYHHHRRRQQQQQQYVVKPHQPVRGKPASVSITSARQFLCRSCSYSTDRKNNLKRHVTTMHRRPDYAAVTSPSDVKTRGRMSSTLQRGHRSRDLPAKTHQCHAWF